MTNKKLVDWCCGKCFWYDPYLSYSTHGVCRFHVTFKEGSDGGYGEAVNPDVNSDNICGQFKEAKEAQDDHEA